MFDDLVDCKRILRETAIMTRQAVQTPAFPLHTVYLHSTAGSVIPTSCRFMTSLSQSLWQDQFARRSQTVFIAFRSVWTSHCDEAIPHAELRRAVHSYGARTSLLVVVAVWLLSVAVWHVWLLRLCDSDMKKLIKTDVLLTPLHINTLLYNLLVGSDLSSKFKIHYGFMTVALLGTWEAQWGLRGRQARLTIWGCHSTRTQ